MIGRRPSAKKFIFAPYDNKCHNTDRKRQYITE